jgi:hypothetical protein
MTLAAGAVSATVSYPILSVAQDYTFDFSNPYNSSFSVTNEGYLTAHDLTAICVSDFAIEASSQSTQPPLPLTTTTDERQFAQSLEYKHRASIPCNSNIMANGHPLMPNAKLRMTIAYHIGWLHRSQEFNFYLVKWWNNTYRWEYGG